MSENSNKQNNDMERRELLKGLATVPVLGLFLVNLWQKLRRDTLKKSNILSNLVQEKSAPAVVKNLSDSRHLNIGIIGYGGRGSHLISGAGFATNGWCHCYCCILGSCIYMFGTDNRLHSDIRLNSDKRVTEWFSEVSIYQEYAIARYHGSESQ